MNRVFLVLLLFLATPVAFAQDYDFFNVSDVNFLINISGEVVVSDNNDISNFSLIIHSLPQQGDYTIISNSQYAISEDSGDSVFIINRSSVPSSFSYNFLVNYSVNAEIPVISGSDKLLAPISSELSDYLEFDYYTLPPDGVIQKASELAGGLVYRYDAVLTVMEFVHDYITYNLEIAGQDLKDVNWVWENRVGTCDEYSVLSVSMLRSLGIPARFVHGYVYSNLIGGFGPHSWIEVFLGDEWIPFDPTYAQYGFVDVSHVPFSKSLSAFYEQILVQYLQINSVADASLADVNISVFSLSERVSNYTVRAELDRERYFEDDYGLIIIDLFRDFSGVQILPLRISTTQEINKTYFPDYVLITGERTRTYAVFKTPEILEENTYFIHPVSVSLPFSDEVTFNIENYPGTPSSSLSDVQSVIPPRNFNPVYDVVTSVFHEGTIFSLNLSVTVNLQNAGNTVLSGLVLKIPELNASASVPALLINRNINISIPLILPDFGIFPLTLELFNDEELLSSYKFEVTSVRTPVITLNADYSFNGSHVITVGFSDINNASLKSSVFYAYTEFSRFSVQNSSALFIFDDVDVSDNITVELVVIDFSDESYTFSKSFPVERTFLESIILFIKRLIQKFMLS